ncbi:atypical chemokine receptor 2 [Tachyglossus aculeatus]|uniref:atypical chemokine receptor 2 n=1 Tax=Tachyglossus aculeatus TaxID=9261 RepID=UPI0018F5AA61|nr:atypical chemokine receptor 2 [Tachyglossus aculeatus]
MPTAEANPVVSRFRNPEARNRWFPSVPQARQVADIPGPTEAEVSQPPSPARPLSLGKRPETQSSLSPRPRLPLGPFDSSGGTPSDSPGSGMFTPTSLPAPSPTIGPENTSLYDYFYTSDELMSFLPCRKDAVRAFGGVFMPTLFSLVSVSGAVGNLLLLGALVRTPHQRGSAEVYLLHLAACNLLLALTLPFWAVQAALSWTFGGALCCVVSAAYTASFYGGVFFVVCLSLDAFLAVARGGRQSRPRSFFLCSVVWGVAAGLAFPDLAFARVREDPGGRRNCEHDYGLGGVSWRLGLKVLQNVLGFLFPLLCLLAFYGRLGRALATLRAPGRRRAVGTVVAPVAAFFVLWCPYNLALFLHSLQDLQVITDCASSRSLDYALQVTESLAFTHCSLTPVLYTLLSRRLRAHLGGMCRSICPRAWNPPSPSRSAGSAGGETTLEDLV